MSTGRVSIVIPAFNAARFLQRVIERIPPDIHSRIATIWIVNDGSTDGTGEVVSHLVSVKTRVRAVTFPINRGYGAAMKAGLAQARREAIDAAICLHADGQYAPEAIPSLLEALDRSDLVQGSRIASGTALTGGMPLYKFLAGHVLTTMENIVFRMHMTDYHSGFLCYGRAALDCIAFDRLSNSFDFDLEVIASARAAGLRIREVPIPTHYGEETSYLNPVTYGLRVLRVMKRYLSGTYTPRRHP